MSYHLSLFFLITCPILTGPCCPWLEEVHGFISLSSTYWWPDIHLTILISAFFILFYAGRYCYPYLSPLCRSCISTPRYHVNAGSPKSWLSSRSRLYQQKITMSLDFQYSLSSLSPLRLLAMNTSFPPVLGHSQPPLLRHPQKEVPVESHPYYLLKDDIHYNYEAIAVKAWCLDVFLSSCISR